MRIALLTLLFSVLTLLAAATRPSAEHSAAVLTGTVLSAQKVTVVSYGRSKSEIWRAEVRVQQITKQDTNLAERVFLYYEQDHVGEDGTHYEQVCPGRPNIAVGDRKTFYCIRGDAGEAKRVLFIPQEGWVTAP